MAVSKKKRTSKTSAGIHGATHHPLSEVEKVLAGKGQMQSVGHVPCKAPWQGTSRIPEKYGPAFPEQARLNRELYPDLFGGR